MDKSLADARERIRGMGRAVVCFSGGIDSTALLSIAKEALGDGAVAVMADVPMLSERQRDIALVTAKDLGVRLETLFIGWDGLGGIEQNGSDRCYLCKKAMYTSIRAFADGLGIESILNGDLADDDASDRPGMRAAAEFGIISPFRDAGATKPAVQAYTESLDLELDLVKETCMLMRYPVGTPVTEDDLELIEDLEYGIRSITGLKQLRVRMSGRELRLQTSEEEMHVLRECEPDISDYLESVGFRYTLMDQPYRGH